MIITNDDKIQNSKKLKLFMNSNAQLENISLIPIQMHTLVSLLQSCHAV